ncbi:MAG TPA: high-potential iron-sulfur protein [Casimicrobiaceae bacterium]
MQTRANRISRRATLMQGAGVVAGLVLTVTLVANKSVLAKAAKSDFLYQDRPHDGQSCGACKFFSPDTNSANSGACALVEGVINRNGWCTAYSPKA